MLALVICAAVIFAQKIDQVLACRLCKADLKRYFPRRLIKVVQEENRVVAPIVSDGEHRRIARRADRELSPASFRNSLAHPNNARRPIQQRIWVTALLSNVDVLKPVGAVADDR